MKALQDQLGYVRFVLLPFGSKCLMINRFLWYICQFFVKPPSWPPETFFPRYILSPPSWQDAIRSSQSGNNPWSPTLSLVRNPDHCPIVIWEQFKYFSLRKLVKPWSHQERPLTSSRSRVVSRNCGVRGSSSLLYCAPLLPTCLYRDIPFSVVIAANLGFICPTSMVRQA